MWKLLNLLPGRRRRMERELEKELRYHVDRRIDDLVRSGVSDADARRPVALEFGGVLQVQEDVRDTWVWRWLDERPARPAVCRPPPAPQSRLRGHRAPVARAGHRRQRRGLLAGRSGPAAPPAGERAGSSRLFQVERHARCRRVGLRLPEVVSALPRAPGAAAGLRWCRLPSSDHGQSVDGAAGAAGARRDRVGLLLHASSACSRMLGRLIDASDDVQPGGHPVVVIARELLARTSSRRSGCDRTEGLGQWLSDDGDRRRAREFRGDGSAHGSVRCGCRR